MFRNDNRGGDRDGYSYSNRQEPGFQNHYGHADQDYDAQPLHDPRDYQPYAQPAHGFDDGTVQWSDDDYGAQDFADDTPPPSGRSGFGNLMAATASLALLIGVGVWGGELVQRDVSGVPVVRALDGPMRKAPEDPGGQLAQNLGLEVNNVAAVGSAEGPADRLVLAPEPVKLTAEDTAMEVVPLPLELAQDDEIPAPVEVTLASGSGTGADRLPQVTSIQPTQRAETNGTPLDLSTMADRIASGSLAAVSAAAAGAEPDAQQLVVPTSVSAPVAASDAVAQAAPAMPSPRLRPQGLRTASASTSAPAAGSLVQLASADLDNAIRATFSSSTPAQPATGGRMVQLGAVTTPAQAEQEWSRLSGILGSALSRYERLTQAGTSGGREIYRLRLAGFATTDDASRFCATVRSRGPDCILVPR